MSSSSPPSEYVTCLQLFDELFPSPAHAFECDPYVFTAYVLRHLEVAVPHDDLRPDGVCYFEHFKFKRADLDMDMLRLGATCILSAEKMLEKAKHLCGGMLARVTLESGELDRYQASLKRVREDEKRLRLSCATRKGAKTILSTHVEFDMTHATYGVMKETPSSDDEEPPKKAKKTSTTSAK